MVSISLRLEFLIGHLLPSSVEVQGFVSAPGGQIDYCQLPLTAQMMDITTRLIDNPYRGGLYLTYVEALTLELLRAAVGNFWSLPERPTEEYSERELRALGAARQMLMEQLAPAQTLRKIARSVGLGEKALTRGFKTVYGESVFDFSLRCRTPELLATVSPWSTGVGSGVGIRLQALRGRAFTKMPVGDRRGASHS